MENKNVVHRIKNSYFSLDYISGGCSHVLWAVGWCSTPGEEGWGTPDFRRWPGWSKDFLGVWNFRFRGSLIEAGFFLIVKLMLSGNFYCSAWKLGMGSFWVLIFAPSWSSLSLKIRCTHPSWGSTPGGHLGIFWVGMCRPGLQIGIPF